MLDSLVSAGQTVNNSNHIGAGVWELVDIEQQMFRRRIRH